MYQLDIKNAFLHGDLQEEVFIEQSQEFIAQGWIGKVCRLRKSLYGLKQSLCLVKANSVRQLRHLACKRVSYGIILPVVYVDDIVITGSDSKGISSLK